MIKTVNGLIDYSAEEKQAMEEYKNSVEYKLSQIEELKQKLSKTDYIACKIAEGAATKEEYKKELEERQSIRDEINQLQKQGGL